MKNRITIRVLLVVISAIYAAPIMSMDVQKIGVKLAKITEAGILLYPVSDTIEWLNQFGIGCALNTACVALDNSLSCGDDAFDNHSISILPLTCFLDPVTRHYKKYDDTLFSMNIDTDKGKKQIDFVLKSPITPNIYVNQLNCFRKKPLYYSLTRGIEEQLLKKNIIQKDTEGIITHGPESFFKDALTIKVRVDSSCMENKFFYLLDECIDRFNNWGIECSRATLFVLLSDELGSLEEINFAGYKKQSSADIPEGLGNIQYLPESLFKDKENGEWLDKGSVLLSLFNGTQLITLQLESQMPKKVQEETPQEKKTVYFFNKKTAYVTILLFLTACYMCYKNNAIPQSWFC